MRAFQLIRAFPKRLFCMRTLIASLLGFSLTGSAQLLSAQVIINPSSISFNTQTVGTRSTPLSISVTNTGTKNVTVNLVSVSPSEFYLTMGTRVTLNPRSSTSYGIGFLPDLAQTFNGQFILSVDSTNNVVSLSGTGISTNAISVLNTSSLSFTQPMGVTSAAQTLNIANKGTASFKILSLTVAPAQFSVSGVNGGTVVNPGQTLPVSITFTPTAASSYFGALTVTYDVLPPGGVALTGTGTASSSLVVNTLSQLPDGTQNAVYSAIISAAGGTPPYSWSMATGSTLPTGLSLSSAGVINGTFASSVGLATYTFTVQVTDSASNTSSLAMSLKVDKSQGANCSNITFNITGTNTPIIPIDELGTGTYLGQQGGLYANGSNVDTPDHHAGGLSQAGLIQPLDASGSPSLSGKIGVLFLGPSTALYESNVFISLESVNPTKNPYVVLVQGGHGGESAAALTIPNSPFWPTILNFFLPQAGITPSQVQAAWIESVNAGMTGSFPGDISTLQTGLESIAQLLYTNFPNIKVAYFSSRIYSGYANGVNLQNPEPFAYESGYAVQLAIQDQINGLAKLNWNPAKGPVSAPWIVWGPYYWANGMTPRGADGILWGCQDLQADGTHPTTSGDMKVASAMLNFFNSDPTVTPWFLVGPVTQLSPTSLTFGPQLIGTISQPQTVTLSNSGASTLTISTISSNSTEFAATNNCNGSVAPGGNCSIQVTFNPSATGTRTGTVTLTDNAFNSGGTQTVGLTGTGTATQAPAVSLSPAGLTFATQEVGITSPGQTVTLTNTGNGPLNIGSIAAIGTNSGDFSETTSCGSTLASGSNCGITVTFTPTLLGPRWASVQVTDDAGDSPQSVPLSGTGGQGRGGLSVTSLNYGNVVIGTSTGSRSIILTNTGAGTVTQISVSVSGDYSQTNDCPSSLAASAFCTIKATFTPIATGLRSGILTVTDSAVNSPQTANLSGTGVLAVTLSAYNLVFPNQAVGTTSPPIAVTMTNNSPQVAVTSINITTSGNFGQTNNCGTSLRAHSSCTINVTFTPLVAGTQAGNLTVTDSANNSPQVATLTGGGINAVTLSPSSLNFGAQTVGTTSSPRSISVQNYQFVAVNFTTITTSGDYAQTNNCMPSLAPRSICTVSVTFTPTAIGSRTGQLTLTDDASNSPQIATLYGSGR
jgi:ASPM-SPD-2-Hydin domain-containing protein/centrosomal CEP192-like protein